MVIPDRTHCPSCNTYGIKILQRKMTGFTGRCMNCESYFYINYENGIIDYTLEQKERKQKGLNDVTYTNDYTR